MARAFYFALFAASLGVSSTMQAGQSAIEWPTKLGGNGHWYEAVLVPEAITWLSASAAATARGGHLATPTSAAENDFILTSVVPTLSSYEGFGPILGGRFLDGAWQWVTGESWKFTAWGGGEPSSPDSEPFLHYQRPDMGWNDYDGTTYGGQFRSYIIEWSADCNSDGVVDFGQIQSGALADADADGVPDICEDGGGGSGGGGGGGTGPNLVLNGSFDSGTIGWSFSNIDGAGGWRPSGGQPDGYFILNDGGSPSTDPAIEQVVEGLQVGAVYRLRGRYKAESSASSPVGALSFAVDVNGEVVITRPAVDTTIWRDFEWTFVAMNNQSSIQLRAEISGTDNDFAIDNIELFKLTPPPCAGDVTGNGSVNAIDLAAVLDSWGTNGRGEFHCDLNDDGIVSGADLTLVLGGWGACE